MLTQPEVTAKLIALGATRYYADRQVGSIHWVNLAESTVANARIEAILRLETGGRFSMASSLPPEDVPFPVLAVGDNGRASGRAKRADLEARANALAEQAGAEFIQECDGFLVAVFDFQPTQPAPKARRRLP